MVNGQATQCAGFGVWCVDERRMRWLWVVAERRNAQCAGFSKSVLLFWCVAERRNALALVCGRATQCAGFGVWPSDVMRWFWCVAERRNALVLVCGRATQCAGFGVWPSGVMRWLWCMAERRNALALLGN